MQFIYRYDFYGVLSLMTISVIIVTFKRDQDLLDAVQSVLKQKTDCEVIIIDNNPESVVEGLLPANENIRYYKQKSSESLMCARNLGTQMAKGDIVVYLDDDAVFENSDALCKVKSYINNYKDVGCFTFRIENYYSRKITPKEFPHPDLKLADQKCYVSYFSGGAHAFRKKVLDEVGPLLDMGYGGEELELSFRVIKQKYKILYTPDILVLHKVAQTGRFSSKKLVYFSVRNRYFVLTRHLPFVYLLINTSAWNVIWFYRALRSRALKSYFSGLYEGLQFLSKGLLQKRDVVGGEALHYLKQNGGRLWF